MMRKETLSGARSSSKAWKIVIVGNIEGFFDVQFPGFIVKALSCDGSPEFAIGRAVFWRVFRCLVLTM